MSRYHIILEIQYNTVLYYIHVFYWIDEILWSNYDALHFNFCSRHAIFCHIQNLSFIYETMKPFICATSKYVNIIEQLWFHIIKPIDFVKTLIDEIKFTIPRQKHIDILSYKCCLQPVPPTSKEHYLQTRITESLNWSLSRWTLAGQHHSYWTRWRPHPTPDRGANWPIVHQEPSVAPSTLANILISHGGIS